MSLFAGIFARNPGRKVSDQDKKVIREYFSHDESALTEYDDDRLYLAKFDFGAFGGSAFRTEEPVAALTGQPFLHEDSSGDRSEDLVDVATALVNGDHRTLSNCRGSFSVCSYDRHGSTVRLATGRIGVRPLYYCCLSHVLIFGSSLKLIEAIPQVPNTLDPRGMVEDLFHGHALADRTPYAEIRRMRGGSVLSVGERSFDRNEYFRWSHVSGIDLDRGDFCQSLHDVFVDGVRIRSAHDDAALSFLSGGLDSRAVVGALRMLDKRVFTLTYAAAGLKDGVIARKVADRLGTIHTAHRVGDDRLEDFQREATDRFRFGDEDPPDLSRLVFSGDGGSVGLGFSSRLDEERVQRLREHRFQEVIDSLGVSETVPSRSIFPRERYHRFRDLIAQGVREELRREPSGDPARDFYRFLMENDQRRHLDHVYEGLDRHQTEFLLPFFDGRFLQMVAGAPIDWFLRHKFYNDWIQLFPPEVTSVAWQVYPGHAPCPVEPDDEIASAQTQWEATWDLREKAYYREAYRTARSRFFENPSAHGLLSPVRIGAALLLHGVRARDYSELWPKVTKLQQLAARSGGRLAY